MMKPFLILWLSLLSVIAFTPCHLTAADGDGEKPKAEEASEDGAAEEGQDEQAADETKAEDDQSASATVAEPAVEEESLELPVPIQCGTLTNAILSESGMNWVVIADALRAKQFEAPGMIIGDATEIRTPGEDKTFALLTVEVAPGRSIGRQDYVLKSDGETHDCLAIRPGGVDTYDFRRWQIEAKGTPQTVTLLFEIPSDTTDGELTFTLGTTVPQPPVPLSFAEEYEPAAGGTAPEAASEPAPETPAADDGESADEASTEAKEPAAKPAAEPAAKPAAKKPAAKKPAADDDWN
ncbi:MAG: hypothetical protein HN742_25155 [Lentisphaerae bacterium]|jgi:hypothetical protein|nr:hypothetical protein [Lentisphaerota bacterium]MBT4819727.1 hypothetical protein [Lentisphaerota bacterium]MBT5607570.1 hypothetical protein [Lentisphaerota bacterium]MBT7054569.1 hypothetical protein [Lentisphaerota bacterium]MBT7845191.1 hypothetical protein [Lentisphaerota bacterium]